MTEFPLEKYYFLVLPYFTSMSTMSEWDMSLKSKNERKVLFGHLRLRQNQIRTVKLKSDKCMS